MRMHTYMYIYSDVFQKQVKKNKNKVKIKKIKCVQDKSG